MLDAAQYIGQYFTFVRVDFFDIDGVTYLGAATFFPNAGYEKFSDVKYDYLVGKYFD